ncbi:coiled-coil domain-containing protein [Stackebrandtia soli]|uniref:coiled-coil domain-containing protein n=1 Tax=Stackebrandtia soli TaxID=1892856 RepID=UPI0039ED8747
MTRHFLSRQTLLLTAILCALSLVFAQPAAADPDEGSIDGELSEAIDAYLEAEQVLAGTKERQKEIKTEIKEGKARIKELSKEVNAFAEAAYRNGGISSAAAILSTGSPERAVEGISIINYLGEQQGRQMQDLLDARESLEAEKEALADEVEAAAQAVKDMRSARDQAANNIAAGGGGDSAGPTPGNFRAADPAPRNSDGTWPYEGCDVDDPTTNGCISGRTLHALQQSIYTGFDRYTACYRSAEDGGEHPRGKACDFSVEPGGFGGHAGGEAFTYGENLAAWLVENAGALGVRYVIWNNQIWEPANGGWGYYAGCGGGNPSCDHTNHVHLSMI